MRVIVGGAEGVVSHAGEQRYGESLNLVHVVGSLAARGYLASGESGGPRRQLRAEFDSAVGEFIKSDPNLGPKMEISRVDRYERRGGKVMSYDGKMPVAELVHDGYKKSRQLSFIDQRYATQATRDGWDEHNVHIVDAMSRGETGYNTRLVVSLLPQEAIARDGRQFWKELGYFVDQKIAMIQLYHLSADGTMVAANYSVSGSDVAWWKQLFAEYGVNIPANESSDNWLQYAITDNLSEAQALELAEKVRARYYELSGQGQQARITAEALIRSHQVQVDDVFENLYLPFAESYANRQVTEKLAPFISQMLQNAEGLNPDIRQRLILANATGRLDDETARNIHSLILYGVTELLRLPATDPRAFAGNSIGYEGGFLAASQQMIRNVVGNISSGVAAGRVYSACGNLLKMGNNGPQQPGEEGNQDSPQETFGGKGKKEHKKMNCPFCKSEQWGDPCSPNQFCTDCTATVRDGKIISTGNGGITTQNEGLKTGAELLEELFKDWSGEKAGSDEGAGVGVTSKNNTSAKIPMP